MNKYVYTIGDTLYLNITNQCTNKCVFCIRYKTNLFNKSHDLWLKKDPEYADVIKQIPEPKQYKEIVFCGYGEPLCRLDLVLKIAEYIKQKGGKVRLDTNGHGNLISGENIVPKLKGLIDSISISLNAQDAQTYQKICPSEYGEAAYQAVLDFAKEAKKYIPKVTLSVVDYRNLVDVAACKKIAEDLGMEFRVRKYYEDDYPEEEININK